MMNRRIAALAVASTIALGVIVGGIGTASAKTLDDGNDITSPLNSAEAACVGDWLSARAEFWIYWDGTILGRRSDFYLAYLQDPVFWEPYNVRPGEFGSGAVYSVSASAKQGLIDWDGLLAITGCGA